MDDNLTEASDKTVRKLTLYGVLPVQAVMSQLEAGFLSHPMDRATLQAEWQRARQAYAKLTLDRSNVSAEDVKEVEGVTATKLEAMRARVRKYAPYDTHTSDIRKVRISKLVTPQIIVNVSRAERRGSVKEHMTEEELFNLSFEAGGKPQAIRRQTLGMAPNGGSLLFTSYDEDIRAHHPPIIRQLPVNETDLAAPKLESVCIPIGGGLPFAAAYRIQIAPGNDRLILANGIHRAYRLAATGHEWCYLAVTELTPLELPDPFVDLPKEILLHPAANPPLITDFVSKELAIGLVYQPVLKTIRLNWNFEQYVTVLT